MIMDQKDIKKILTDLYAIDPSLESKEADLVSAIKFLRGRKSIGYDNGFYSRLREKLLSEPGAKNTNHGRYFMPVLAVSSLVLLCFVGIFGFDYFNSPKHSKVAVERVQDNAFGAFPSENVNDAIAMQGSVEPTLSGPIDTAPSSEKYSAGALGQPILPGISPSGPAKAIQPVPVRSYAYVGDDFIQSESNMDVLKKMPLPFSLDSGFGDLFGIMDLDTFSRGNVTTVTFQQDDAFGYIINIDFANGTISINENYSQWQSPENSAVRLEPIDDNEIKDVADKFLKSHKIPVENYGKARVVKGGYPESAQVVYPLVINNKNVYNPDGTDVGILVSIDMRHKLVSGVYGLGTQKYQASSYPVIQDAKEILSMAGVGDKLSSGYSDGRPSDADLDKQKRNSMAEMYLGTPQLVYVQVSKIDNGAYSEFLVPAFLFPIENPVDLKEKIIVPLVKSLEGGLESAPILPSYDISNTK
jgi:hypothetical protein